ncbi:MAG TPA: hypothetical protein VFA94_10430 [Acidimicrobiales bacterium]|nr:hypothetical protein [Acidimicrobiales bacterium]
MGGPASADTPEVFAGSAAARALDVHVINHTNPQLDFQATLGVTEATADSTLKAVAKGTGELLPQVIASKTASADASNPNAPSTNGCDKTVVLPDGAPQVLNVGIACGKASASAANNLPVALSEASVAGLNLDGQTALTTLGLDGVPGQLGSTLGGALDTVCQTLAQACDATTTVKTLVTEVLKTRTLDVSIAPATSSVVTTADAITSTSTAAGAVVKLLPLPDATGLVSSEPVATIEVSSAKATATYDRIKGVSAASFDPAVVRVKFNSALSKALNVPADGIAVKADALPLGVLDATPLASQVIVAGGSTSDTPAGGKKAVADGVTLKLLTMVGESTPGAHDGGIVLSLAHAEAAVGGAAPVGVPPKAEAPIVPAVPDLARGQLPRTGGPGPWLPVIGGAVLGLAVLVRRAVARAH